MPKRIKIVLIELVSWLFAVAILAAVLIRIRVVESVFGNLTACRGCFVAPVAIADAAILAPVALVLGLAALVDYRPLSIPLRAASVLVLVVYVVDVYILHTFNTRLRLGDIAQFGDPSAILSFLETAAEDRPGTLLVAALGTAAALAFVVVRPPHGARMRVAIGYATLGVVGLVLALIPSKSTYVHRWGYVNFVQANVPGGEGVAYSSGLVRKVLQGAEQAKPSDRCVPGAARRPNIIMLVIESLSDYQSAYFSGLNDWTPRLDEIARENLAFKHFVANGFTTNHGLISLLTGQPPLQPVESSSAQRPFEPAWNLRETLVSALERVGYSTVFLTTGNLGFSDKGVWLRSLGFDVVEGHDSPAYDGLPRFHFSAAPDAALYAHALELLTGRYELERFADYLPAGVLAKVPEAGAAGAGHPWELVGPRATGSVDDLQVMQARVSRGLDGSTLLDVAGDDPTIVFTSGIRTEPGLVITADVEAPEATSFQVFYLLEDETIYSEAHSARQPLVPGLNHVRLSLPRGTRPRLRIDPGGVPGRYALRRVELSHHVRPQGRPAAFHDPFFLVLETVSSHHPYVDPLTREHSVEKVFKYVDAVAGRFYDVLRETDFFRNGMLLIVSDHRSMTPLTPEEARTEGRAAPALVPLIVADGRSRGTVDEWFQQIDLPASLARLTADRYCPMSDVDTGDLLTEPRRSPRCMLHVRGDYRDEVEVLCGDTGGTVKVEGDATRLVSGDLTAPEPILSIINTERIRGQERLREQWSRAAP